MKKGDESTTSKKLSRKGNFPFELNQLYRYPDLIFFVFLGASCFLTGKQTGKIVNFVGGKGFYARKSCAFLCVLFNIFSVIYMM